VVRLAGLGGQGSQLGKVEKQRLCLPSLAPSHHFGDEPERVPQHFVPLFLSLIYIMQTDFLTALKTHREYCRSFLDLARQQAELADSDEYDQMIELLNKKQRVIALMNELAEPFGKLSTHWKIIRGALDLQTRVECETAISAAEGFLAEAMRIEQSSEAVMVARRDETQRELQALANRQHFNQAARSGHQLFSDSY
jgi:hypothetical protein